MVEKDGFTEERIYLGSYERYRKYVGGSIEVERDTVHISDDTGRIAMLEVRNTVYNDDGNAQSLKRFIYASHLQSSNLELDEAGEIISYEEYHPYGTTAYQAMSSTIGATAKRYRFTGKERDEETGLNYHGARYYAPWLCRWTAVDPLESKYAGWSSYNYCTCNPINHIDSTGEGNDDDKKAQQNVAGYTVKTVLLDKEGHPMPDGTKFPYSEGYTNTKLGEHKKNLDKGEVEAGTQVLLPAQGEGGMETITVTYRLGWGEKEGKPLLWAYQDTFEPHGEQKLEPIKPVDDGLNRPNPKTTPELNIPIKSPITPLTARKHLQPHPHPIQAIRPLPLLKTTSASTMIGGGIWRADLSQEGFNYMKGLVSDLKGTNLGAIEITFGIPANMNLGKVIHSGEGSEIINPSSKRVTSHYPMKLRATQATGNMDVRNVEAQGRELQGELSRRLKVPVRLDFKYNFNDVIFRFTPKRTK